MTEPSFRRVLSDLRHGEHVTTAKAAANAPTPADAEAVTVEAATRASEPYDVTEISTPFGYLFTNLSDGYPAAHLPADHPAAVVIALKALGSAMVDQPPPDVPDSTVPPIYTYWGQFVDHDLTANTDRESSVGITDTPLEPLDPDDVVRDLRNLREPQLNLDSLYGNGPAASGQPGEVPFVGDAFELGTLSPFAPPVALPGDDLPRDPVTGAARIGDGRNDENLVVAQLHVSFLKFHNAVLDWFAAHPGDPVTAGGGFDRARRLVQWHYQWVTVHDFLARVTDGTTLQGLLDGTIAPLFAERDGGPYMPLEFSIAGFRFGHSMVRAAYDWNENFGAPGSFSPDATFDQLFQFTGNGGFIGGAKSLPNNWPAQFERFTGAEATPPGAPADTPPRLARAIDTHLADPLFGLRNEGNDPALSRRVSRILKRLAVRNLLRGYRLALPTGQAVAAELGITPLTTTQLLNGSRAVGDALVDGGFVLDTPLWFYVLREAEVLGGGDHLGPVGSRIVCETILGQLRVDPDSFLNNGFDPSQGVTLPDGSPVDSIVAFLRFAGMHA